MTSPIDALRMMALIRAFETALAKRPDHGFQLLSTGEEAVAVGVASALRHGDQLLTGGRSIGPALARGVDPDRLMAELLGRKTGTNQGRGGRGHLADPASGFFGAHAVVAGNLSIAAGVALARKLEGHGGIVAVLFGDGAAGAGLLHETLNIAALWKLPLLFVCNNNQYSVSTSRRSGLAPAKISDLGSAFGLPSQTVDGMVVGTVAAAMFEAAEHVRSGQGPAFVECLSIRLLSHSTTARETRSRDELQQQWQSCPIARQISDLDLGHQEAEDIRLEAEQRVARALAFADASSFPDAREVLDHVG
jgi:TPP-dependent pyruvate/acetoin dehydrogenase alpha subunit